ncbi:MAG TPA: hypothetical protein VJN18_28400 [Polyangiaceae bacterium]|nr:hypothetical protein [Polyangiaceae bacterium]
MAPGPLLAARRTALALLLLVAPGFAQSAGGSTAPPAPESAAGGQTAQPAAPAAPAGEAANPGATEAPKTYDDSTDTRGDAMRAYQKALDSKKLGASAPLSIQRLQEELPGIEEKVAMGRRDEAIGDLVYLIESPRFEPFASSEEGKAALFLLGDSLAGAGALEPARGYLTRLLKGDPGDTSYRRAVRSLVDAGLASDRPEVILKDLEVVPPSAPDELTGDIDYLRGRASELGKKPDEALAAYAKVGEKSRFWAQATYLSGVLEVEKKNFKRGEQLFCKVADKKQTPKRAAMFGGSEFFRVRDLARLGLGRVAHEQYRFDDARYYYYLVPNDSENISEALYETATTRYEAKDYDGARQALDDLKRLKVNHVYEDEAYILDSYVDLATCHFPQADKKLDAFIKRYEPVRDAARRIVKDGAAMKALVDAVRTGADPASAGLGVPDDTARALGSLLRVDSGYGRAARRLSLLDHQLSGLRRSMTELDEVSSKLSAQKGARAQSDAGLSASPPDKVQRIESQIRELKRLLREAERTGKKGSDLEVLSKELSGLEVQARAARASLSEGSAASAAKGEDLSGLIARDRELATELYQKSAALRLAAEKQQLDLARDSLQRLEMRLSRLLRRARLGRIETVLGKKRSLEIEIEALSQGLLPQTIIDSLDAQRYLGDDEEYWPFEGEDWEDEYVGGEGLR